MFTLSVRGKRSLLNNRPCRIKQVGIELEGGWTKNPVDYTVIRDGSVTWEQEQQEAEHKAYKLAEAGKLTAALKVELYKNIPKMMGEIVSPPLYLSEIAGFMSRAYPSHVNATCGLHVHMSFYSKLHYQKLMNKDFAEKYMVDELAKWAATKKLSTDHPIWNRLSGQHTHCQAVYLGPGQVKSTKKDYHSRGTKSSRYTVINYCAGQHGTIECRVLPMFDTADLATEAVHKVISATNMWLSKNRHMERPFISSIASEPMKELTMTISV